MKNILRTISAVLVISFFASCSQEEVTPTKVVEPVDTTKTDTTDTVVVEPQPKVYTIASINDGTTTSTFTYETNKITITGGSEVYIYETKGNQVIYTTNSNSITYYIGTNGYADTSIASNGDTTTYSYDTQGYLISSTKKGVTTTFTYANGNQIGNSNGISYTYTTEENKLGLALPQARPALTGKASKNLMKSSTNKSGVTTDLSWTLNSDGYPTGATIGTKTYTFTYNVK